MYLTVKIICYSKTSLPLFIYHFSFYLLSPFFIFYFFIFFLLFVKLSSTLSSKFYYFRLFCFLFFAFISVIWKINKKKKMFRGGVPMSSVVNFSFVFLYGLPVVCLVNHKLFSRSSLCFIKK